MEESKRGEKTKSIFVFESKKERKRKETKK